MAFTRTSFFRACGVLAMLPLLGGCVAALAVPAMTAVGMLTQKKRTRAEVVAALPAANAATLAALPGATEEVLVDAAQLTNLTELPPPSGANPSAADPWREFAAFALERASGLAEGEATTSALLTPQAVLSFRSEARPCAVREAAVVIDLDTGQAPFTPAPVRPVATDVAATVARLRASGVIVLWVSQASANEVEGVAEALKASGLDPTGRDPILLVRNEDERKQVLREEANQTVCVVAIAGDQRSDFDELFDYLRDPNLASAYDAKIGSGWFIVPPLFTPANADQVGGASARP